MKKTIALFISGLCILCLSVSSPAQSSENELDQAELMKKFIGTWKYEHNKDTISLLTFFPSPYGEGYEYITAWESKGVSFWVQKGIAGFTAENVKVNWFILNPDGITGRHLGEFVNEDKLVMANYNFDHSRMFRIHEYIFLTPDKFKYIHKQRGEDGTWDNPIVYENIWVRVKE